MDDGEGDHLTTSFSQLLFSDNDNDVFHSFDHFPSSSSSVINPPKMLCFEGYLHHLHQHQKSGVTCADSSSSSATSSTTSTTSATIVNLSTASKSNRKRNGSGQETGKYTPSIAKAPLSSQRSSKKIKKETSISNCQPKARKEKLGERITALQQLVTPFGKTDTASVLHEAMGYIRFLHDQVQVLCSAYLQHQPVIEGGENGGGEETRKELRSRGLCLVPVDCALHVASSNGADYWSPAMSSTKQ